jgi:mannose-6-phosphate isomerase-like protein (cupin superfamily)
MKLAALLIALALTLNGSAFAQSGGKADVFSASQLSAKIAELATQSASSGSSGATLADYGSHKVQISVRASSGGGEIHAHFDDVMIVQQGSAILITGGSVIDAKTGPDGETKGSGIQGGKPKTIGPGDIVTVNAGIPHQILVTPGVTYSAVVIKIHE